MMAVGSGETLGHGGSHAAGQLELLAHEDVSSGVDTAKEVCPREWTLPKECVLQGRHTVR